MCLLWLLFVVIIFLCLFMQIEAIHRSTFSMVASWKKKKTVTRKVESLNVQKNCQRTHLYRLLPETLTLEQFPLIQALVICCGWGVHVAFLLHSVGPSWVKDLGFWSWILPPIISGILMAKVLVDVVGDCLYLLLRSPGFRSQLGWALKAHVSLIFYYST